MAKIFKGDVNFGFVINQTGAQPLDSRSVVQSYAELLKSETFGTAIYNGMTVATIDEQKVYMLVDKTKVTSEDGWKEIGAGSGSLAIENFTLTDDNKIAEATAENIGQIIYITKGVESYPAGPYIVIAEGEVSKLGTTTATGDIAGDVESLKTRVGNVEANKADLTGLTALTKTVNDNYNTYDAHAKDAFIHITQDERTNWNHAHEWSSGNTIEISNLKSVVSTKADASALTNYLTTEQAGINDETVRGLITAETEARVNAITSLTETVNTKASVNDFNTLTGTVESNYNALNSLITAETTARTEAISSLTTIVNAKASNDDLTAHTNNGDIHVTTDDKEKWNNAANKVDVILSGTGVEGVIDTFIDFNTWLTEHGNEVSGMQNAITTNANSITSLTKTVTDNYTTLEGLINNEVTARTEAISSLTNLVNTKANQSDLDTLITSANTLQNSLSALEGIVGSESGNTGIFAKLSALASDKLTADANVNGVSFVNGEATIHAGHIALEKDITRTGEDGGSSTVYPSTNSIQSILSDLSHRIDVLDPNVSGELGITSIVEGSGISAQTSGGHATIAIKASEKKNNAIILETDGIYVQAITIDGADAEIVSGN